MTIHVAWTTVSWCLRYGGAFAAGLLAGGGLALRLFGAALVPGRR